MRSSTSWYAKRCAGSRLTNRSRSPPSATCPQDGHGSSSSLTVGLLTALHGYQHRVVSPRLLAEQACRIEIDVLGKPIGRQDQYAAAFGGVNYIRFNPDDTVDVEPVPCRAETLAELEERVLLLYTGQTRDADQILERQSNATIDRMDVLRGNARPGRSDAVDSGRRGESGSFRGALARGLGAETVAWVRDQQRSGQRLVRGGAAGRHVGGKLLGAGGGGFLLLVAPPWRHRAIREALGRPRELPFRIARHGSRNIFIQNYERPWTIRIVISLDPWQFP